VPVFFLGGILFDDGVGFCGLELSGDKSRQERLGIVSVWKDGGEEERGREMARVGDIYSCLGPEKRGSRNGEK
jgi:hypothetical protein